MRRMLALESVAGLGFRHLMSGAPVTTGAYRFTLGCRLMAGASRVFERDVPCRRP
jgi:hypothetical protein